MPFIATLIIAQVLMFHPAGAQQKKPWKVPKNFVGLKNPSVITDSAMLQGKALYLSNCAPCHGTKGDGKGPANASISPNPANHSAISMLNETDGTLFYKISEGRSPMPGYKDVLTDGERWSLVEYIRTLIKVRKK